MKLRNASLIALLLVSLGACKSKEDVMPSASYSGAIQVNFNNYADPNSDGFGYLQKQLDYVNGFIDMNVQVKITNTTGTAPSDITVYIAKNDAVVSDYNSVNGTTYTAVASNSTAVQYDFTKPVIIKAGQRTALVPIKVNVALLNLSLQNALGIVIQSASGASVNNSQNQAKLLIDISFKNIYDADYTTSGYFFHPSSPRALSDDKHLYTVGAATCEAGLGDLYPSNYYFIFDISGTNTLTNWVADLATPAAPNSGFMTLDNPGGTVYTVTPGPGTSPWLSTTYNNTYNPSTYTFYMHYGYVASGGTSQNSYGRQVYEKWVKD
jgi:hypothetical protein